MNRMYRIKALGFKVIYIWERDFKNYGKTILKTLLI